MRCRSRGLGAQRRMSSASVAGQRESQRVSRLATRNSLDSQPFANRVAPSTSSRESCRSVAAQYSARVWLLSTHDTSTLEGGAHAPLPPTEYGRAFDLTSVWPGDYVALIDMRVLEGPRLGQTTVWLTTPLAIVEGEPVSALARFALLVDTANGIAVRHRPAVWQFPNVDLTTVSAKNGLRRTAASFTQPIKAAPGEQHLFQKLREGTGDLSAIGPVWPRLMVAVKKRVAAILSTTHIH